MRLPLKGIIPPLVTPLNNFNELDLNGLQKLIEHLLSGGVHALFILGTNGEAASLGFRLRKELIRRTCEQVRGRVPVLVGISDTSLEGSLDLADYATRSGADALVVAPPYYYPLADKELLRYFETLSSSLELPFFLYNIPSHTKIHLNLELVRSARQMGAVGIKDSSGDMKKMYALLEAFRDSPGFTILTGTERFLAETVMHGGHGSVAGGANMFPGLFVDLYKASVKGDTQNISMLSKKVDLLYETIYRVGKHPSRFVTGTKCALSLMGICNDYMAPPLHSLDPSLKKRMEGYIEMFKG